MVIFVWLFYATGSEHRHQLQAVCVPLDSASSSTTYNPINMAEVIDDNTTHEMENWMAELPERLQDVPINNLALPGSHNSCSYTITPHSDIAPDNEYYANKLLKLLGPIGKQIMYSWSLTQSATTREQLQAGVRYFDLRIAIKKDPEDENLYLIHGLFGSAVDVFFAEVKEFLEGHRKEVLLLHFQHFYNMTDVHHNRLLNKLTTTFGPLMCQFTKDVDNITLSALWRRGYQIITFYAHDTLAKYHPYLWPTSFIPNPWPDEDDTKQLVTFWNRTLSQGRDSAKFFVLQGVGTPQPSTVTMHICNSLKKFIVPKVNAALETWLVDKSPGVGAHTCNVIMLDFVDMEDYRIPKTVIAMNQKLLDNDTSAGDDSNLPGRDVASDYTNGLA